MRPGGGGGFSGGSANVRRGDLCLLGFCCKVKQNSFLCTGRRKEIYEVLHPETKHGAIRAAGMNMALGNNVAAPDAATFTSETAKATGKAERTVRLSGRINRRPR